MPENIAKIHSVDRLHGGHLVCQGRYWILFIVKIKVSFSLRMIKNKPQHVLPLTNPTVAWKSASYVTCWQSRGCSSLVSQPGTIGHNTDVPVYSKSTSCESCIVTLKGSEGVWAATLAGNFVHWPARCAAKRLKQGAPNIISP